MRAALAIAMATLTLTLGVASRPINGQMRADDPPALETIRMVDRQTGWAVTRYVGALLRTTDGGTRWRDVTPLISSGSKIRVFEIAVLSPLIAWVSGAGPSDSMTTEIFRTFDGGRTWRRSAPIPAPEVSSISFINPREGWLIAFLGAYGKTRR